MTESKPITVYHAHQCVCAVCNPGPLALFASRVTAEQFRTMPGQTFEHYKLPPSNMQRTGDETV